MPDLAAFQQDFLHRIDDPLAATGALAVYRNTALLGAVSAIADNFPSFAMIVGLDAARAIAAEFVDACPPRSPILASYGAEFPAWLEVHPLSDDLPYLAAVARIDLLRVESHLAADAPQFGLKDMARLSAEEWSRCRVTLHPATRVAWFDIPAPSIWIAHFDPGLAEIAPEWRAEGILITRREGAVGGTVMDACGHRILHGLRLGESVGQAALAASRLYPAGDITGTFRALVEAGAISSLRFKG